MKPWVKIAGGVLLVVIPGTSIIVAGIAAKKFYDKYKAKKLQQAKIEKEPELQTEKSIKS